MAHTTKSRRDAGQKANRKGKLIEKGIDGMHEVYRMQRRAIIARLNVPTRLAPKQKPDGSNEWVLIQCGQAPIDFAGTLPKGEAIFLEVKSTLKRSSLPLNRDKVHERHQFEELAARHRLGAHALLLWFNEDRIGILTGAEIDTHERSAATNIQADRFIWMEPGEWDWLAVWQDHMPIPF